MDAPSDPRTTTGSRPPVAMLVGRALFVLAAGLLAVVVALTGALLGGATLVTRSAGALSGGIQMPDDVELSDLEQRSVVYAADGSELAVLHDTHDRRSVPLDEVPEHVRHAVLAAEDRRFHDHDGYDAAAIGRAVVANVRAQGVQQGGSTITQQLAKQNFVGADRTVRRKLDELTYAVALEASFTKDELLERYLNQVYFGAGAYGIAAAAEEFFRATPATLSVDQAALLAGVIRSPSRLDPRNDPEGARQRRDAVLAAMAAEGWLEPEAAAAFAAEPVEVAPPLDRTSQEPYVVAEVKRQFFEDPAFGDTRQERIDLLFNGGLEIHTTIDPAMQAAAAHVVEAHAEELDGPTAGVAAVEPVTGRVLAVYSGADFATSQYDLATQARRQPGSAYKPFVLAAALEDGVPLSMPLEGDSGAAFEDVRGWTPEEDGVRNFGDARYGRISPREALVRSVNTAFADLVLDVGYERVMELTRRLGIADEAYEAGDGPAIALGGLGRGVTPLEMASAYAAFAGAGQHTEAHLIERVVDRSGREVFAHRPEAEQVLEPEVNAALVDMLRGVVTGGTGTNAQLAGREVIGKTGTTQNSADAWFAGSVPGLAAAVWVGHPEGQVPMDGMTGGSLPATLWREFVRAALEGREPGAYPDAGVDFSSLRRGAQMDVPDVRRMPVEEAEAALAEVRLRAVTRREASGAAAGTVLWQSPGPGNTVAAGGDVVLGVSTGTPPPPPPEPEPEPEPTGEPTPDPTGEPTPDPTGEPTPDPTGEPTPDPTGEPTPDPTGEPTPDPTGEPTAEPTPTEGVTEPPGED